MGDPNEKSLASVASEEPTDRRRNGMNEKRRKIMKNKCFLLGIKQVRRNFEQRTETVHMSTEKATARENALPSLMKTIIRIIFRTVDKSFMKQTLSIENFIVKTLTI